MWEIQNQDDGFILKPHGVFHCAFEAIATESIGLNSRDGDDDDSFASNSEAEFEADVYRNDEAMMMDFELD